MWLLKNLTAVAKLEEQRFIIFKIWHSEIMCRLDWNRFLKSEDDIFIFIFILSFFLYNQIYTHMHKHRRGDISNVFEINYK